MKGIKLKKIMSNFHMIEFDEGLINGDGIWFSYETPIAFRVEGKLTIRRNDWKQTTGKHLNYIDDDKSIRISGEEFEKLLDEAL